MSPGPGSGWTEAVARVRRTGRDRERVACPRCSAPYDPTLTDGCCPVCSTEAPGSPPRSRIWDDADDRLIAIVVAATLANVVLLAVLAIAVLR